MAVNCTCLSKLEKGASYSALEIEAELTQRKRSTSTASDRRQQFADSVATSASRLDAVRSLRYVDAKAFPGSI